MSRYVVCMLFCSILLYCSVSYYVRTYVRTSFTLFASLCIDALRIYPRGLAYVRTYVVLFRIGLLCMPLLCFALLCIALPCIALHCVVALSIALHCCALHYIEMHWFALLSIDLHHLASICLFPIALHCCVELFTFCVVHCFVVLRSASSLPVSYTHLRAHET